MARKKVKLDSCGRGVKKVRKMLLRGESISVDLPSEEALQNSALGWLNDTLRRAKIPVELYQCLDENGDVDGVAIEYAIIGATIGAMVGIGVGYVTGQWIFIPSFALAGAEIGAFIAGIKIRVLDYTDGSARVEIAPA